MNRLIVCQTRVPCAEDIQIILVHCSERSVGPHYIIVMALSERLPGLNASTCGKPALGCGVQARTAAERPLVGRQIVAGAPRGGAPVGLTGAALSATRAALVEAAERRADAGAHRDAAPVDVAGGGVLCERVADAAGDAAREHPAAHVRGHTAELADDESGDLPADDASGGSEQALDRAGAEGPER